MANPLLALQVETPDVAGNFAAGQESAQRRNTARLSDLINQYKLQSAQRADEQQNQLRQLYQTHGPGIAAGDPTAIAALARTDPAAAQGFQKGATANQGSQFDLASKQADFLDQEYASLSNMPVGDRPMAIMQANQRARSLGISEDAIQQHNQEAVKAGYSDTWLKQKQAQVLGVKGQLDEARAAAAQAETASYHKGELANQSAQIAETRRYHDLEMNKPDFNAPTTIEISDGKGGTQQVLAQQEKKTGQWVSADQKRTPLDTTDMKIVPPGVAGGQRSQVQNLRMISAGHTLANELENIAALPSGSTAGWFGGATQGGSLTGAVKSTLAREVTPQSVQAYQVAFTGMSRALSQLEAAGLAPPNSLTSQMEGLRLNTGDTEQTRLQKLATIRQTGEGILEAIGNGPSVNKKQSDEIKGLQARLVKAIPFLPIDVINLSKAKNPGATIADMAKARGLGDQPSTAGSGSEAPQGVDPKLWGHMTPEEQALWKK